MIKYSCLLNVNNYIGISYMQLQHRYFVKNLFNNLLAYPVTYAPNFLERAYYPVDVF